MARPLGGGLLASLLQLQRRLFLFPMALPESVQVRRTDSGPNHAAWVRSQASSVPAPIHGSMLRSEPMRIVNATVVPRIDQGQKNIATHSNAIGCNYFGREQTRGRSVGECGNCYKMTANHEKDVQSPTRSGTDQEYANVHDIRSGQPRFQQIARRLEKGVGIVAFEVAGGIESNLGGSFQGCLIG